jgi:hypothetical protein
MKGPTTLAHDVFELEEYILRARNVAEAIRIMASSDTMRGEGGDALAELAQFLLIDIDHIKEAQQGIWKRAGAD